MNGDLKQYSHEQVRELFKDIDIEESTLEKIQIILNIELEKAYIIGYSDGKADYKDELKIYLDNND